MKYIVILIVLLCSLKEIKAQSLPANDATWTLVKHDDFNSLNTSDWYDQYWSGTSPVNNGDEYNSPSNLYFNHTSGFLSIKCEKLTTPINYPSGSQNYYPYQSGVVFSSFQYKYGYWEISAKFPVGEGYWPAFWLLETGTNACTVPGYAGWYEETDILENGGEASKYYDSFGYNYHWRNPSPNCQRDAYNGPGSVYYLPVNGNISNENKIGLFWEPGRMTWYFNDVPVKIINDPVNTPSHALKTIINFAVDPGWKPIPSTTFPAWFEINYLKIWQLQHDCSTTETFCSNFNAATWNGGGSNGSKVKQSISIGGSGCSDNINISSDVHFWATDYILLDVGTTITNDNSNSFSAIVTNCPN